jgi:two-component system, OmpR family, sensor histidine kinase CiaH
VAIRLSIRTALVLFAVLVAFVIAQATWWIIFMARLVDEKIELAEQLNADPQVVARIHQEEIDRQIMIGLEGVVFLLVLGGGLWIIYTAYVRLQDLNRRQENFLMATTHELKTPLSSISLYLDALQSERIPDHQKEPIVPRIREDVHRLQTLVEKILQARQIGREPDRDAAHETFDFTVLVNERLEALLALPTARPVEVNRGLTPSLMVSGSRQALAGAIDQLLENAAKYTNHDTVTLSVTLDRVGTWISLRITDNGIGLSKHDTQRIFERFERVGNEITRGFEGTGLGLYLCREIVRAHGGHIRAFSDGPTRGSTFEITLKAAQ